MYDSSQSRTEWENTWLRKNIIKQLLPVLRAKKSIINGYLIQDQSTLKKEIPSVKWVSVTGKDGCIVVGFEFTGLSLQQCP
jgi:hypothetical protein